MPARFRVLLTDRAWPDFDIERRVLAEADAEVVEAPDASEPTLIRLSADVDAIGTCWGRVTAAVIRAATRCRAIARFGIGLDNIDVGAARARGMIVTRVPDYCLDEVAEHTLALALALVRNVAFFHLRTKRGEYALSAGPTMHRLSTRTLGLVGFGRIARVVHRKARGMGWNVVAWSRSNDPGDTGCRMTSLDELLAVSDVVSLHLPLADSTRRLIDAAALGRMKPTASLVNTSRGGLVDLDALYRTISAGRLAGAALDVFDPEPPDLSRPLYQDERVIVTPHAAFLSEESLVELRTRAARQLADVLTGQTPQNVVNA